MLPTLQEAISAHFVEGGYLDLDEIEACAAKLRGDQSDPTGVIDIQKDETVSHVRKVMKEGRVLIIRDGVTYDVWGHILTK